MVVDLNENEMDSQVLLNRKSPASTETCVCPSVCLAPRILTIGNRGDMIGALCMLCRSNPFSSPFQVDGNDTAFFAKLLSFMGYKRMENKF